MYIYLNTIYTIQYICIYISEYNCVYISIHYIYNTMLWRYQNDIVYIFEYNVYTIHCSGDIRIQLFIYLNTIYIQYNIYQNTYQNKIVYIFEYNIYTIQYISEYISEYNCIYIWIQYNAVTISECETSLVKFKPFLMATISSSLLSSNQPPLLCHIYLKSKHFSLHYLFNIYESILEYESSVVKARPVLMAPITSVLHLLSWLDCF